MSFGLCAGIMIAIEHRSHSAQRDDRVHRLDPALLDHIALQFGFRLDQFGLFGAGLQQPRMAERRLGRHSFAVRNDIIKSGGGEDFSHKFTRGVLNSRSVFQQQGSHEILCRLRNTFERAVIKVVRAHRDIRHCVHVGGPHKWRQARQSARTKSKYHA